MKRLIEEIENPFDVEWDPATPSFETKSEIIDSYKALKDNWIEDGEEENAEEEQQIIDFLNKHLTDEVNEYKITDDVDVDFEKLGDSTDYLETENYKCYKFDSCIVINYNDGMSSFDTVIEFN